jgi:uncharacterized hydrophobic protein (TIGR00271 family)
MSTKDAGENNAKTVRLRKWRIIRGLLRVSAERRTVVLDDIAHGSIPSLTYYVLLGVSGLIAGFGLLSNSAAVVVGAMLVSPLMTPIFGITVSLISGETTLLRRAMIAEFGGVFLVLLLTYLLGLMPFSLEITPEMLARTRPNLLDLFVAVFAGFAGCMAMLDERISPALPGVAIATSLTPPLATSGLSLAFGSYQGAWGSFLLFFANFLAILVVAAVIFSLAGLIDKGGSVSKKMVLRRFLTPVIGLIAVSILLTDYLVGMINHWQTLKVANQVIIEQLADEASMAIEQVVLDDHDTGDSVNILAVVRAPRAISPEKTKVIENALRVALNKPVQMYFRCSITYDVTATGSANLLAAPNLDGNFTEQKLPEKVKIMQISEQVIREMVSDLPQIDLQEVRLLHLPSGPVVLASILSPREPLPEGIQQAEKQINDRLDGQKVQLLLRVINTVDITAKGRLLLGDAHFDKISPQEAARQNEVEAFTRKTLSQFEGVIVISVDAIQHDDNWQIRAAVIGPKMPTPADIQLVEKSLSKQFNQAAKLALVASVEAVVTDTGYHSAMDLFREKRKNSISNP